MSNNSPTLINLPYGCPPIPSFVCLHGLVAVVKMHHVDAYAVNETTTFVKTQAIPNQQANDAEVTPTCTIFLSRKEGDPTYIFGRSTSASRISAIDVYLPKVGVALKQFVLLPARKGECWRVDATSEILITVNDVPTQKETIRTKKQKHKQKASNPHAVYLDEQSVNTIEVLGVKIEIWLVQRAEQILYLEPEFVESALSESLQKLDGRMENWAKSPWMLKNYPQLKYGTGSSYVVVHRFSGVVGTAKLFQRKGTRKRTKEMLTICRRDAHESLVKYQAATNINGIPAIVTDTHDDMAPYGAVQASLKLKHPGYRFEAATRILRSVFGALEYLHFYNVVHRSVDFNSVLVHFDEGNIDKVLLVDYSLAKTIPQDRVMPRDWMVEDSLQAMALVEDCCDIWGLRKAKRADAQCEAEMRRRTVRAMKWYDKVKRACAVVFSQEAYPGAEEAAYVMRNKCRKVLAEAEMKWSQTQTNELHNASLVEIGVVTLEKLYFVMADWKRVNQEQNLTERHDMILTLGHKFLDRLATPLYKGEWDMTPRDICTKIRSLEGETKIPWRSFTVSQEFHFRTFGKKLVRQCMVDYLAVCCDVYSSRRTTFVVQYAAILLQANLIDETIRHFRESLARLKALPPAMNKTLRALEEKVKQAPDQVFSLTEEHEIVYHVPSSMFNVTQLHRLATCKRLNECLSESKVGCDTYVEVRGERKLQGHYIPLALLRRFAVALGVVVKHHPASKRTFTAVEPADFSNVSPGRIVLARTGLIAFATVARASGQFSHAPESPLDFELGDPFLPTYFGNIKVLQWRDETGFELPKRAEHWAKFKTADELEQAEKIGERRSLTPTEQGQRKESRLERATRNRLLSIAKAQSSKTRTAAYWSDSDEPMIQPKRQRVKRENPGLTEDFKARNPHLRRSPPQRGTNLRHTLPAIDGRRDHHGVEKGVALMQRLVAQRLRSDLEDGSNSDNNDDEGEEENIESLDGASTMAASDDEWPVVLPVLPVLPSLPWSPFAGQWEI